MRRNTQQNRKARPGNWPALLLLVCLAAVLAILGSQMAEYLLSFRRDAALVKAQTVRGLPAEDAPEPGKMDVNAATAADFQRAEGIGPVLAQAIVDARDRLGGFQFLEELMDVPGIGGKRYEALKQLFYCSGDP